MNANFIPNTSTQKAPRHSHTPTGKPTSADRSPPRPPSPDPTLPLQPPQPHQPRLLGLPFSSQTNAAEIRPPKSQKMLDRTIQSGHKYVSVAGRDTRPYMTAKQKNEWRKNGLVWGSSQRQSRCVRLQRPRISEESCGFGNVILEDQVSLFSMKSDANSASSLTRLENGNVLGSVRVIAPKGRSEGWGPKRATLVSSLANLKVSHFSVAGLVGGVTLKRSRWLTWR